MASGAVLAVWVYDGHCTPLIFSPPLHAARYAPPSLAPAPTTRPEVKVVAKSSSPWVVYLSISLTGNCDGSLSMAPRSSHFSPHTPLSSLVIASFSDGFRRDDTVLVSSLAPRARKCSKINGGRS